MTAQLPDAVGTAQLIRNGGVSAREVVEQAIGAIEKLDAELNAVVSTRFEEALAEVDAGLPDGPLRGVPILIKDLGTDVAGLPSTQGSRLWADAVAVRDSELIARYRRAGMVVLGKTNTPELGKNTSTEPQIFGPSRNPWDTGRSTGGSSGGSAAAVASGMVPVAHGNDGGGSIRIPAALCGLFGLKPSRGRIPGRPYTGALTSPVSVHHALTTTVRDSALLLDVVSGAAPGDAYAAPTPTRPFTEQIAVPPGRLRIGLATATPGGVIPTDPACVDAVERAGRLCAELGHDVTTVTLDFDFPTVAAAGGAIMAGSLPSTVDRRLAELGRELREDDLEPMTRLLLEQARTMTATQLVEGLRVAEETGWQFGRLFTDLDILLTPTVARTAPPLGLLDTTRPETIYQHATTWSVYTSVFNLTGQPAMSVPCGTDPGGLPVGVQFAADLGGEGLLLRLAAQLEEAMPWPRLAPAYRT